MIRREAKLAHSNGRTLNADQAQGSFSYKHYFKARGATRAEISRSEKKAKEKPFKDEEWEEHFRNYLMDSTNRQLLDRILQAKLPAVKLQYDRDKVGQYEFDQLFGADNAFEANAEFLARLHGEDPLGLNFLRGRTVDAHTLTKNELMLLLFSEENSMLDPAYVNEQATEEYLSAPLSHYWINSSHNTYLTGNQYSSVSSVECYVRALQQGCRCLELDCWDGDDNEPDVFHGHTLTSRIKLLDVVKAIAQHAFSVTDLPLVLSIENHCKPEQQARFYTKSFNLKITLKRMCNNRCKGYDGPPFRSPLS